MANKLINRFSRDEFIDYIRLSSERESWDAIGDAAMFITHARVSKAQRAELDRTLDKAMAAYKQTFGEDWLPF